MKKLSFIILAMFALVLTACQDKDIDREAMKLAAPDAAQITGQLTGDDYTWTWPSQNSSMQVATYRNGTLSSIETISGNSYTHKNVPTNVPFEYVFKLTDGSNFSTGVIKNYLREGATSISGVQMSQLDKAGGYDALVVWDKAPDASSIQLTATNGKRTINETLSGSTTQYVINDVETGDTWEVALVAKNDKGTSLSTRSSLRIGKTAIGFLSIYATPEEPVPCTLLAARSGRRERKRRLEHPSRCRGCHTYHQGMVQGGRFITTLESCHRICRSSGTYQPR